MRELYYSGLPESGAKMSVDCENTAIVVFTENPHGAVHIFDVSGIDEEHIDLTVDRYVKSITDGIPVCIPYRFIKKVDNVYFYQ